MQFSARRQSGFTIIEVIIVLAIMGLIILVLFLVVPVLQRNSRNYARKNAINYIAAQLQDYYALHDANYPYYGTAETTATRDAFIASLLVNSPAQGYTITYTDANQSHSLPYDGGMDNLDTIYIMAGHFCQRDPGIGPGDPDYPFKGSGFSSDNYAYIAVATILEGGDGQSYCADGRNWYMAAIACCLLFCLPFFGKIHR